ncbi:MAG TPA: metallophosphoesterase [Bryobacteraceae bacterium]|nr:metallophosphoesterase [Bryobacteraceae bacterium]
MFRKTALIGFLFALLSAAQGQEKLVGGPVVVNVGSRDATVVWVVQTSEAKLGLKPDQLTTTVPVLRAEKVTYSGLKPGLTYHYDVLGQDSGKGSFQTAPSGPAPFNFIVYGDTRSRHDMHQRIVDAMVKAGPEFVIHTGDLVADGANSEQWSRFFSIEKELLRRTVFFPVLGNHERNNPQYFEFFDMKKPYYSFNWGSAHFALLDTGIVAAEWDEQTRWLGADLERAAKADFRFVIFHEPPYTAVKKRQSDGTRSRTLVPLLEKYKVHAVFSGHDHNYQRHVKDGVQYIVTGGGGAPLYPVDGPIEGMTRKVVSTEHYVQVKVEGKTARLEAVALDGSVIEAFEIR